MAESIQHKLDRVRPPRVQITYDVQIGNAIEVKELPLVVGVIADLSGQLEDGITPPKLRDRQFVEIDRDSFRDIFGKINPRLQFSATDLLKPKADGAADAPTLPVTITAEANPKLDNSKPLDALLENLKADDPLYMFNPLWVIRHTPELNKLYEARGRLTDLLSKLDGNDKLEEQLKAAVVDKPTAPVLDGDSYMQTTAPKQLPAQPGATSGGASPQVPPTPGTGQDKK